MKTTLSRITLSLLLAAAFALPACARPGEAAQDAQPEPESAQDAETQVPATESDPFASAYVEGEALEVYQKAADNLEVEGLNAEPVALLATQLVSGTNYAFLCREATGDSAHATMWYVMVVYRNLDDECSLTSMRGLDVAYLATTQASASGMVGGWTVLDAPSDSPLSGEMQHAFEAANAAYGEGSLAPVAALGRIGGSGEMYQVLCVGKDASGANALFAATFDASAGDAAIFNTVDQLDLLSYVGE